ncbi:ABC transporter permease [Leucobacter luti]|uniref:ABC transporter permease n=1 Tax=Leucobacter luti TaxID=340320 RepID=UPI003D0576A5
MTRIDEALPVPLQNSTSRPPGFWRGTALIAKLELMQRRRSRTLWVLGIVWFVIIGVVTLLSWFVLRAIAGDSPSAVDTYPMFSLIVYFVLLFGSLVAPAISAGSIGSDRTGGTLATTQVTLVSTWSILLGKALAAWLTGIAFLVVASPFLILSLALARFDVRQLLLALLGLVLQIGLFTIIGVGLSACISSQVFAIVTAYLIVALLSVGTLIAFALAVGTTTKYVEIEYRSLSSEYWAEQAKCEPAGDPECVEAIPLDCETITSSVPVTQYDRFWWILSMNPYVVLGDLATTGTDPSDGEDLFAIVSVTVRSAQIAPDTPRGWDNCVAPVTEEEAIGSETAGTIPVWWIGLLLQGALAAGALGAGYARLRTPARKLPKGTRIA